MIDLMLTLIVVGVAVAWLASRFWPQKKEQRALPGDVVLGASLAKGLQRARARESAKRVSN